MKAIPILRSGDFRSLQIREWETPSPGPSQVLIRTRAFGVNFADVLARKGQYTDAPKMPFIPGYEVAGEVVQVGSSVTKFKNNDKVLALTLFGGYAEFAIADERTTFLLPDYMTYEQGASIPVNYVTAWHSIFETGSIKKGDKILIHAAAGGVGQAAVQLSKYAGLEIFGTAGGPKKIEKLKQLGVDHAIDYRGEDYFTKIKSLAPQGIHLILDSVGGSQFKKELDLLLPHGRVVGYGAATFSDRSLLKLPNLITEAFSMLTFSVVDLMMKSRGFYGVNMLAVARDNIEQFEAEMNQLLKLFESKEISTVEINAMPASGISEVHRMLESRASSGKFVVTFD
ncbi:MAG: zinc-binding dehydrogenase [Leptospiraceae bacterium]|nr:zinc-binding dehydrogenase [Leptospiraceae bacterium]